MPTTAHFPAPKIHAAKAHGTPAFDTDVDADLDVDNGYFDAAGFAGWSVGVEPESVRSER